MTPPITTSLAPWLTLPEGESAVTFYKNAFGAVETYRLAMSGGLIVRLAVESAEFWISWEQSADAKQRQPVGGDSIRMILTVADAHSMFAQAIKAGGVEVFPVGEEHGWLLGRLTDPFGLDWEIGHPTENAV
ncbi:VOC family protein [uncultured Imperialibacter sp.]|uniref:VOC family protein n=1 Tax=uncultured Imperialibacter sp. TaxID=1672639 RepID=UPI0030D92BAB|tara:strand:+ start:4660 stop:5055 length:396 start_codon:yes stop_codon:yes gene_type:complete